MTVLFAVTVAVLATAEPQGTIRIPDMTVRLSFRVLQREVPVWGVLPIEVSLWNDGLEPIELSRRMLAGSAGPLLRLCVETPHGDVLEQIVERRCTLGDRPGDRFSLAPGGKEVIRGRACLPSVGPGHVFSEAGKHFVWIEVRGPGPKREFVATRKRPVLVTNSDPDGLKRLLELQAPQAALSVEMLTLAAQFRLPEDLYALAAHGAGVYSEYARLTAAEWHLKTAGFLCGWSKAMRDRYQGDPLDFHLRSARDYLDRTTGIATAFGPEIRRSRALLAKWEKEYQRIQEAEAR